jgi:hypothetical protein
MPTPSQLRTGFIWLRIWNSGGNERCGCIKGGKCFESLIDCWPQVRETEQGCKPHCARDILDCGGWECS